MVQKIYGGAKFTLKQALAKAMAEVILTDARIRADEQHHNCPCNSIITTENERERMFLLEAIGILGKTFGQRNFNSKEINDLAREFLANGGKDVA